MYEAKPFHLLIKKPIANAATIDKIITIKPKINILYKILFCSIKRVKSKSPLSNCNRFIVFISSS